MFEGLLNYGYLGITIFLILTGCGLPIPEEAAIIAAAVFAANGTLDPWLALAACLVGAVVGDTVMYTIGRHFGTALLERHPLWARAFGPEQEKKVEQMLNRHGVKMILVTRFLVGLRSPVYFAAGVLRVNYLRFLITDIVCATMVISLFFGMTYFYGKAIWEWIQRAELGLTVAVVAGLLIAGLVYWLHRRGKAMLRLDVPQAEAKVIEMAKPLTDTHTAASVAPTNANTTDIDHSIGNGQQSNGSTAASSGDVNRERV